MVRQTFFVWFLALLFSLNCLFPAAIAAPSLSSQQIQMFQALSADQQNNLLEKLRPGANSLNSSSGNWQQEPIGEQSGGVEVAGGREGVITAISKIDAPLTGSNNDSGNDEVFNESLVIKAFGYHIFEQQENSFAPVVDIPIPRNYILGPGDELQLSIFGKENQSYTVIVSRDGALNIPQLGMISVAGLSFDEVKRQLHQRIKKQFIGVQSHISMGALRSIRIYVMGDVVRAGSYTVSSLSTMTNALFASGGVTELGSLRNIQLKRNGRLVSNFDLYDLLLNGDTRADQRLQPGDVIFVPPVGTMVTVQGAVLRPAIYELKGKQSINDLLFFAGKTLPTAYMQSSYIERIDTNNIRQLISLDLSDLHVLSLSVKAGDTIVVSSVLDKIENIVTLEGHVERPGRYEWKHGMRISDLLPSIDELKPRADLRYALIRREDGAERFISVIKVSISEALANIGGVADMQLHERDTLSIFSLYGDRVKLIAPLVEQLQNQGRLDHPEKIVSLKGNARHSGIYPLTENMRLSDLVEATVNVLPETDLTYVLIQSEQGSSRTLVVNSYNLELQGFNDTNPSLNARDTIYFFNGKDSRQKQLEELLGKLRKQAAFGQPLKIVDIGGRVRHPGSYPYEEGMRISDLLRAAGSLEESAYSLGAEITRYNIDENQKRAVEHVEVDLASVLNGAVANDFVLQSHDFLTIKELPNWRDNQVIELSGEVKFPGIYAIREGDTLSGVVKRAGGLTEYANADGSIFMRVALREKEQKNLDDLRQRLQSELAAIDLEKMTDGEAGSASPAEVNAANDLANRLESTKALGRLVINLKGVVAGDNHLDVLLKAGDELIVPSLTQEVSILGEVFYPTSHLFSAEYSVSEYINMSGGITKRADDSRIYVVKANGAVIKAGSGWFFSGAELQPGDTIVVPLDVDYLSSLRLWTNVSQIVYQLGIAVASWNAVGIL